MRSIRERVLVLFPLLSLIVPYAYIMSVTVGDAVTLARATAIRNNIEDPIGLFEAQVQAERLLATTHLSFPTPDRRAALQKSGYGAIVSAGYSAVIGAVHQMPSATLQTLALATMRVAQAPSSYCKSLRCAPET
jgi:hypothetical protein